MKKVTQWIIALACLVMPVTHVEAGELAEDFVITNRATGAQIRRDDFKGKILLLDFFAYWCPPCQTSSPVVEKSITQYYKAKGGNPSGIKVEVVSVNIESRSPELTDQFIKTAGLKTVANDFSNKNGAWAQFAKASGGAIPHFVIINGTSGGSFRQWEVLHSDAGFRGANFYRQLIDSIAAKAGAPEISVSQPATSAMTDGIAAKSFGTVAVKKLSQSKTFTIKNLGGANLTGLRITKAGAGKGDYIVSAISKKVVKPGGTATFKVAFKPAAIGERQAAISIISNDADENPFDINLTGLGSK